MFCFGTILVFLAAASAFLCPAQADLPSCTPEMLQSAVMRCYATHNIPVDEFQRNISNNWVITTNAAYYKNLCNSQQNYTDAGACVAAEYDRCYMLDMVPSVDDPTRFAYCDDPLFSFTCVATTDHHYVAVSNCVTEKINASLHVTPTPSVNDDICNSLRIGNECYVAELQKCDAYTANVINSTMSRSLPPICYPSSNVIVG
ncbi:uncharacterized protein LOC131939278 [Physella acuta]|uniref:uncharacterized protein LOC131939278 n=1 Tax=Physella acuta TaxID=109671 RepID=UPI0027DCA994|nr:uncharacterized protein LOC131939278 [Physella acuta]